MTEPPADLACAEFSSLYAENSRAIYYLALRYLSNPQKAEDATHDVFLKAFRKLDQFRGVALVARDGTEPLLANLHAGAAASDGLYVRAHCV